MSIDKNVLFISKYYYPHIGGVEKHVQKISELLISTNKYKVTVLTEKYDGSLSSTDIHKEIKIKRIVYPHIKFIGIIRLWLTLLKEIQLFLKSDIIHVHDVFVWVWPVRVIFFWKKIYVTFHGWEGDYPIPLNSLLQKRIAYLLSKGNICVGKYLEQIYGIHSSKVTYGGTNLDISKHVFKRSPRIVYIGRLENDTGLPLLIKSLSKTKHSVIFYGDGPLRSECEKVGIVKGFIKDISRVLEDSDICFAGGYLSTLDSMASSNITAVITSGLVRQLAFSNTYFSKWITKCSTSKDIEIFLKNYGSYTGRLGMKKVTAAHQWGVAQSWQKVCDTYIDLWNM